MKSIYIIVFLLIALSLTARPSHVLPAGTMPPATEVTRADSVHAFDILSYDLELSIDDVNEYIYGQVTTNIRAVADFNSISYELVGLNVDSVKVNNVNAAYSQTTELLTINTGLITAGSMFSTRVWYGGNPILSAGAYRLGMFFNNNIVYTVSDPNATRFWMPCYDHPWDKATLSQHIRVRDDWLVAANGVRTSIDDNNDDTRTHHWQGTSQMATYLFCLTASNYVEINDEYSDIPLQNFCPPAMLDNCQVDFSELGMMMSMYESYFGDYPFEKYGNAVAPITTFAAMEHQTMTTLGASMIDGRRGGENTIAHELVHQWYGNCLTPLTWKDIWLSEGFATYGEALFQEAKYGKIARNNYVRDSFHRYYKSWTSSQGARRIYNPVYAETFAPPVYEKAASVLHMLRLKMGDENFFALLRQWFVTYQNSNVITDEFIQMATDIHGTDLAAFFQQWIYGRGIPDVRYLFFSSIETSQAMVLMSSDNDTANSFDLDIPIVVNTQTGEDSLLAVALDNAWQASYLDIDASVVSYSIDPDNWVLVNSYTEHAPQFSYAYAADGIVQLHWEEFFCPINIDGYHIYRASQENGPYTRINDSIVTEHVYTDNNVENGLDYYYQLVGVVNETFETLPRDSFLARPIAFPFDRDILLVDETRGGSGSLLAPSEADSDDFYEDILIYEHDVWDVEADGLPILATLAHYRIIIWHDDDLGQKQIATASEVLANYVHGGGKIILAGWKTMPSLPSLFRNGFWPEVTIDTDPATAFRTARSNTYADVSIDPAKVFAQWNGLLRNISVFNNYDNPLYTYAGESADYEGRPCALEYDGNGKMLLLGFPLYFCNAAEVRAMLTQVLVDFGMQVDTNDNVSNSVPSIQVQIYPNPVVFASDKHVQLRISSGVNTSTKIGLFNIKGQEINSWHVSGQNIEISWDGLSNTGQRVASGVYFFRIKAGSAAVVKKILVMQ